MVQVHRKFTDDRIKNLFERYLKIKNATPRETVDLRIYPLANTISKVRFWRQNKLLDVQTSMRLWRTTKHEN